MACYYQYFPMEIRRQGWGDCHNCTPDEKNKECKGYYPCSFTDIQIERETNDKKTAQTKTAREAEIIPFPKQKKPKQYKLACAANREPSDEVA